MNSSTTLPSNTVPLDEDLAVQARPGHGIPSQDPNPAAQVPLEPEEARREANSVMAGGGAVGGAPSAPPSVSSWPAQWVWLLVARWVPSPVRWVAPSLAP